MLLRHYGNNGFTVIYEMEKLNKAKQKHRIKAKKNYNKIIIILNEKEENNRITGKATEITAQRKKKIYMK